MGYLASKYARKLHVTPTGQKLTVSEKCVLMVLAEYHNDEDGTAWPSIQTMSDDCCLSKQGVRNALKSLEDSGILRVERRQKSNGDWLSNKYYFTFVETYEPALNRLINSGKAIPSVATPLVQRLDHLVQPFDHPLVQPFDYLVKSHETQTVREQSSVEQPLNNQECVAAASLPATAPKKKRVAKPPAESETDPDVKRVRMHIREKQPSLSQKQWVDINRLLPSLVQHYGPEDLIAWYDHKSAQKYGAHVDLAWANTDLPVWRATKEGKTNGGDVRRPRRADPNQQIPSDAEFEEIAKRWNSRGVAAI